MRVLLDTIVWFYLLAMILFFLAKTVALIARLFRLGTIYIEFDGGLYCVWQRAFLGKGLMGVYFTEADARASVEKLKRNPPRTIRP